MLRHDARRELGLVAGEEPTTRMALPAGSSAWLIATLALVFAGNLLLSRRLWGDAFFDLYAGRYIAQHGIPRLNVVTVASHGAPWIDQQWLAHLSFYGAWAAGGYPALVVLSCALVTAAFGLLAVIMLRRGVPPTRACAWTLAAFAACVGNIDVRAQSFGYLFLALTLWLIIEDWRRPRPRWWGWLVIPVLVLWANTYGSVLLGAGIVVLYAGYRVTSRLVRRQPTGRGGRLAIPAYVSMAALAALSVLCCPYGTGVIAYYERFGGSVVERYDNQWAPPSLHDPLSWNFFALAAVTAVIVAFAWPRGVRPEPPLIGIAAVLLAVALTTYKDVAWFAMAGSLLAADTLTRSGAPGRSPKQAGWLRASAAATGAALALASATVVATTPDSVFESRIPWQALNVAASVARAHPRWNVLSDDWSSGAFVWLQPSMLGRVGLDMRLEQYSAEDLSDWFSFLAAARPRSQGEMARYNVIVFSRSRYPGLTSAVRSVPGWRVVYENRDGIVLVHDPLLTSDQLPECQRC